QDETKPEASRFKPQLLRQNAAGRHIMTVIQVIDEPVAVAAPLLGSRTVLQVIHGNVSLLPFLQRHVVAQQTEFDGRNNEVKTLQLDSFAELFSEIKTDDGAKWRGQRNDHDEALRTTRIVVGWLHV